MSHKIEHAAVVVGKCGLALSSCSVGWAWVEQNHLILTVLMAFLGLVVTLVAGIVAGTVRWHYHRKEDRRLDSEHKARMKSILSGN